MIEITIDGTAASGKGTLAKKLSSKYGFPHLDTGLLYRKVAFELINKKKHNLPNLEATSCSIAKRINFYKLEGGKLRTEETAQLASSIASFGILVLIRLAASNNLLIKTTSEWLSLSGNFPSGPMLSSVSILY